jgi:hypothetical protein
LQVKDPGGLEQHEGPEGRVSSARHGDSYTPSERRADNHLSRENAF